MPGWLGRLLCLLGIHDDRVVDVVLGWGQSGNVEKLECRRCGAVTTRGQR